MRLGSMPFVAALLFVLPVIAVAQNHANHNAITQNHGNHATTAPKSAKKTKDALCKLCLKPIVKKSEVILGSEGNHHAQHHYRCIYCALVAARDQFKGDVKLRAQSALEGKRVEWTRRQGKWQVSPASAKVLVEPEVDGECLDKHLVFSDANEFKTYGRRHPRVASLSPMNATEVNAIIEKGKEVAPRQAICPVTGESFQTNEKTDWTVYKGTTYYFCCAGCKPKFISNPQNYISDQTHKSSHKIGGSCGGHSSGDSSGGHGSGGGGCEGGSKHSSHS